MTGPVIRLSDHARSEIARRGLEEAMAVRVASAPEQVIPVREGREVRQSRVDFFPGARAYLVRVVVDMDCEGVTVVTAYRTSRVGKYWRKP